MRSLLPGLAALLVLLVSCNTLPVGYSQLGDVPTEVETEVEPGVLTGYHKYVPLGSSDTLYLGRGDDYVSRVLLHFPLDDSILEGVTKAELLLYRADNTQLEFVCRPCSTEWAEFDTDWKLADGEGQHWNTPGGDYRDEELCSGTVMGESTVVQLDLDYLYRLGEEPHSLILFPESNGFAALHSRNDEGQEPAIRLTYSGDETEVYDCDADAHIIYFDTLTLGQLPLLRVGSGYAFRTYLRFRTDSVQTEEGRKPIPASATIARADLSFIPETEYSRSDTVKLGIHRLTEPFERKGPNATYYSAAYAVGYYPASDTDTVTVTLDLRDMVQYWTANPDSNFGAIIIAEPEWAPTFRLRIPGSGDRSPRLSLLFVTPPEDRFQ